MYIKDFFGRRWPIIPAIFSTASLSAQSAPDGGNNVSDTLLEHILNGNSLDLFPFLQPLHLPFGMTVHLFMILLASALIITLFGLTAVRPKAKPKGLAVAMESLILFVRDDIVYPVMGEKRGEKWLPFFLTLFMFLLTLNLLGLIPAFKTATGSLSC